MTRNEHNGWTNYETWIVSLWMDNDEGSQDHFRSIATDFLKVDGDLADQSLADILKEHHEESLPELTGFAADLMNAALSEVNWAEIASKLIADAKEEQEASA